MENLFNSSTSFTPEQSIDCYALVGLLMTVGEGAKRLEGIRLELPKPVMNELNFIQKIRDSLEKKQLPANLFESHGLIKKCPFGFFMVRKISPYQFLSQRLWWSA